MSGFIKISILHLLVSASLIAAGQAKVEIYADTVQNDTLKKLVIQFAEQLQKAQWTKVNVSPGSSFNGKGIYVALSNSPVYKAAAIPPGLMKAGIEAFAINVNEQAVQIFGNSNMAIGHGIFTYLNKIGFRYFFANPDWHITPVHPNLYFKWSILTAPALDLRRLWYGYGTGSAKADADYQFWMLANRMGGSLNASFGHSYGEIISRNKEEFQKHPEWFYPAAKMGTIPDGEPKFDMSREDLVKFIIKDVEQRIEKSVKNSTSDSKMISLSPSDGPGTCNSPACQLLGNMSDRVFYLVNRVAKAISKKYPFSMIGCLAYGEYSIPPTKKIEPNVFVGITTAFNNSKFSTEELVDEWRKKGANVGIYDYFSWFAWDFDIPGQSLASRTQDIVNSIKKFQQKGVKAYDAESSIGWISKGLGYYLASRQMWDAETNIEPLRAEFFTLSFKKASVIMQKLWQEWEVYPYSSVRESDLAKWIDWTNQAVSKESDEAVQKRFYQIKAYLYYLYLLKNYKASKSEPDLFELLSFGYRMLDYGCVAGYPAFFELGHLSGLPGMSGYDPNARWRFNASKLTTEEMNTVLIQCRNKLKTATAIQGFPYTSTFKKLPGAVKLTGPVYDGSQADNKLWYQSEWVIQIPAKSSANYIELSGGYVTGDHGPKPIKVSVYPYTKDGKLAYKKAILNYDYTNRYVTDKISLEKLAPGYYTVLVDDPVKMYLIKFSKPVNYSLVARPSRQMRAAWANNFLFYVPRGIKQFNLTKTISIKFQTPKGRIIDINNSKEEEITIQVEPGEEGLWKITFFCGNILLEGVPPYFGVNASQMLVPDYIK